MKKTISKEDWVRYGQSTFHPSAAANGVFFPEIEREETIREKMGLLSVRENGLIVGFVWAIDGRPYIADQHPSDLP